MVGGTNNAFLLHLLDQLGGAVVAEIEMALQEAGRRFALAADQGVAAAQYNLGLMYAKGYGVPQNHIEAHTWFTLAAASYTSKPNRDRAVAARDTEAARMTPAQIAEAQKLAREWKKQ